MRFRYLKDPLFLFCFVIYFANRWIVKPYFPNTFSQDYLNDLICLPFWVPIMLFFLKKVHLRNDDNPPALYEILIPLICWSWMFEVWLPGTTFFRKVSFSDYRDIFCYSLGALIAGVFWQIYYATPRARVASAND
jgi:hypothetical protein